MRIKINSFLNWASMKNFEECKEYALQNENVKRKVDFYLKMIFDNLKKIDINIPIREDDFNPIKSIPIKNGLLIPFSQTLVNEYYNIIFYKTIQMINSNSLNESVLDSKWTVFNKLDSNGKKFIDSIVDKYIREILLPVRNFLYIIAGDIKKLHEEINNLNYSLSDSRKLKPEHPSYKNCKKIYFLINKDKMKPNEAFKQIEEETNIDRNNLKPRYYSFLNHHPEDIKKWKEEIK